MSDDLLFELLSIVKKRDHDLARRIINDMIDSAIQDYDAEEECIYCEACQKQCDRLMKELDEIKAILSLLGISYPLTVADEIAIRTGRYEINGHAAHGAR